MDEFGCYDFKKPANQTEQDMRTSYYRGHRYLNDVRWGNKLDAKFPDKGIYVSDPLLHEKQFSEYGSSYGWNYMDPDVVRNPALNMKMQFMKPFEQSKLRFIKRKMKPMTSITQDTYTWSELPFEPQKPPITFPTPVEATRMVIDRSKIGYTKYLDPSATTYNLSYVHYPPAGISAHDNLTFWNWNADTTQNLSREPDEQMCDDLPAKDCPKRRCEYQNQVKSVPHSGLISEVRENYHDPKYRKDYLAYDTTDISPLLTHENYTPIEKKSEYAVYGSGESVLKYV